MDKRKLAEAMTVEFDEFIAGIVGDLQERLKNLYSAQLAAMDDDELAAERTKQMEAWSLAKKREGMCHAELVERGLIEEPADD